MKDLKEIFESRRSVNYFDPNKQIDNKVLKEIIELSTLAPSCFNLQPWEVLVIKSEEWKKKLYNEACKQDKVLEAPVVLAIIGNTRGFLRENPIWDEKIDKGATEEEIQGYINYSKTKLFPSEEKKVAFAARNSSLLAMSIMYAAKYYGLDTHPMIGFDEDKVKEVFSIDEDKIVTMLIALGYHDESKELKPRGKRLGYNDIVKEF
ncbi:nitroreductase family protein [Thermohalobacter berrensis]|uniref:Nitroreductase n=1 Tax=Thermohalobacter berrensis TaxID=99594 RepID=A0A419SZ77_9FIRM|nr:nitroreductase family protein [Thermohalobacter berrensis]RKD30554.1 nitroreductase [Thermohalobacter berrensis]